MAKAPYVTVFDVPETIELRPCDTRAVEAEGAGAPEIEITEEMIEAGSRAARVWLEEYGYGTFLADTIARDVLLAALRRTNKFADKI